MPRAQQSPPAGDAETAYLRIRDDWPSWSAVAAVVQFVLFNACVLAIATSEHYLFASDFHTHLWYVNLGLGLLLFLVVGRQYIHFAAERFIVHHVLNVLPAKRDALFRDLCTVLSVDAKLPSSAIEGLEFAIDKAFDTNFSQCLTRSSDYKALQEARTIFYKLAGIWTAELRQVHERWAPAALDRVRERLDECMQDVTQFTRVWTLAAPFDRMTPKDIVLAYLIAKAAPCYDSVIPAPGIVAFCTSLIRQDVVTRAAVRRLILAGFGMHGGLPSLSPALFDAVYIRDYLAPVDRTVLSRGQFLSCRLLDPKTLAAAQYVIAAVAILVATGNTLRAFLAAASDLMLPILWLIPLSAGAVAGIGFSVWRFHTLYNGTGRCPVLSAFCASVLETLETDETVRQVRVAFGEAPRTCTSHPTPPSSSCDVR